MARSAAILVLSLLAVCPLLSQNTGTIHGTVSDPSGLAVPNATITATLIERGATRTTQPNDQGNYVLTLLPVGTYEIRVEAAGFKQFRQQGITVSAAASLRVDARLDIGAVSEAVRVTAEATLVDSRSSVVGSLIDSRRVLELPTNGRNIIGLAMLLPGVTSVSAPQTFTGDRSGPTVSVAGSRGNSNLFLFDGAQHNAIFRNTGLNYPPPDALQEVKVLTNNYSAEYGRNSGTVFNVVTKSGTNEYHGAAWEFLRNQKLNARNFFAPSDKPQLIQNQFGAAGGGPIRKDKLFVFGSYEGLRVRPAALSTAAFPLSEAERRGDFSAAKAVTDPLTKQPFAGNLIPASRIDTVARSVMSNPEYMPLPNRPDGQLVQTFPLPVGNDQYLVRADYNRSRHVIDSRYNYNRANELATAGNVPTYSSLQRVTRTYSFTAGDTFTVRANLLNQFRVSYNRFLPQTTTTTSFHLSDLGANFPVITRTPPYFNISGRITLGDGSGGNAENTNESWQFSESLQWMHGSHTIKAGMDVMKMRYDYWSSWQTMGIFNVNGSITGNAAADFVLGLANDMTLMSPNLNNGTRQWNTYYYVQDDWRIHPRLTLNLGIRYELPLPWVERDDKWGTFSPGRQSQVIPTAPVGLLYVGDAGVPRGIIQTDKNNWAPRVGLAWDPFGNGRTSVRAAFGLFYETLNADVLQNTNQPFYYVYTINAPPSFTDPLHGLPPLPTAFNRQNPSFSGTQTALYFDPGVRSPYVMQYNLNVQREVVKDLLVQVGYVGRGARKLPYGVYTNPALYGPGATLRNIDDRRIYRGYGPNWAVTTQANSSYNGLQLEVTKRYSRNFSIQGAYTFNRSIDMNTGTSIGPIAPNTFDLRSERGLAYSPHIFSASWIWDLPKFASAPVLVRKTAGGWQLNGLIAARSGSPFNVVSGRDVALSSGPNQRPNVIGDHRLSSDRSKEEQILAWFNSAAFAYPVEGSYGNVARNALIGPGSQSANLGLFKNFALPRREGLRLQFRSEFFNAFNNVNLGTPRSSMADGVRMGRITSAGGAREIQFALKLLF